MLDAAEIAKRLRKAMDDADPPMSGASLAAHCGVTPQAVSGWRKTGRIHKHHLEQIAAILGKSLAYFLSNRPSEHDKKKNGHSPKLKDIPWAKEEIVNEEKFLTLFRAWQDTGDDGREILLGAVNAVGLLNAAKARRSKRAL